MCYVNSEDIHGHVLTRVCNYLRLRVYLLMRYRNGLEEVAPGLSEEVFLPSITLIPVSNGQCLPYIVCSMVLPSITKIAVASLFD